VGCAHHGERRWRQNLPNARSDKLTGYTWRYATKERRCLIPATGYYEPGLGPVGAKGEILFIVKERPLFFFAGLWEPIGDTRAFTMVTTEPNDFVRQFHDRMPVVLSDDQAREWLGDTPLADDQLQRLCRGLPAEALDHETLPPKLRITKTGTKQGNRIKKPGAIMEIINVLLSFGLAETRDARHRQHQPLLPAT